MRPTILPLTFSLLVAATAVMGASVMQQGTLLEKRVRFSHPRPHPHR
jgi:hypothetical protein